VQSQQRFGEWQLTLGEANHEAVAPEKHAVAPHPQSISGGAVASQHNAADWRKTFATGTAGNQPGERGISSDHNTVQVPTLWDDIKGTFFTSSPQAKGSLESAQSSGEGPPSVAQMEATQPESNKSTQKQYKDEDSNGYSLQRWAETGHGRAPAAGSESINGAGPRDPGSPAAANDASDQSFLGKAEHSILHGFELVDNELGSAAKKVGDVASTVATKTGNVADIAGLVGEAAWEGAKDTGKAVGQWVVDHPKTAVAIGVGVLAVAEVASLGTATPAVAAGLAALGTVAEVGGTVAAAGMTAKSVYDVAQHGEIQTLWNQQDHTKDEVDAAKKGFINDTKGAAFFDATLGLGLGAKAVGSFLKGARAGSDLDIGAKGEQILGKTKEISTGDWGKINLAEGGAISTENLGPCVGVVSDNGAIAHLNPDAQGPEQVNEFVQWLKANSAGSNGNVALVGGMDNMGQSYLNFNSSSDLVGFLKGALKDAGFNVKFEDLYGYRQRAVTLDSTGKLDITDSLNKDYHKSFSFNE
jgi:hypothetical protein